MDMRSVLFLPYGIKTNVPDGYNLLRAANEAGVYINTFCGGEGTCGRCKVKIEEGNVEGGVNNFLDSFEIDKNIRLACNSYVKKNIVVRLPAESITSSNLTKCILPKKTAKIMHMSLDHLKEHGFFVPTVEKIFLDLRKEISNSYEYARLSDIGKLLRYLKKYLGKGNFQIDLNVIRKVPNELRKGNFCVTLTFLRPVNSSNKTRIINIQKGNMSNENFAIAIDIGTTTVHGELFDLKTGDLIFEKGFLNKQVLYGEDIISRIVFSEKEGGLEDLNILIIETINQLINLLIKKSKKNRENISIVTFAGNTTMTQFFLKIDPRYIRISPYVTATTLYPPIKSSDINISLDEHSISLVYPVISSYVGGDIIAGVMGSGMYLREDLTLFIDIGTNAEIVIGNKDWFMCAACSAGPAFEGGGIEFGMRASLGAIEDFSIDPVTLEPILKTIGDELPKGICGSGLISIVAVMFEMGIINSIGKFNIDINNCRIRKRNDIYEFVLAWSKSTQIGKDISINETDIENLIRTKGAIFSGCLTLLKEVGFEFTEVDQIILAGGFGSYIDLDKAMTIGLLPEFDFKKITFVGNSSLMGAKICCLTNKIRLDVGKVVNKMTNCELSEVTSYMDNYVASLFLPHTDIEMFPKLKKRMKKMKK